MALAAFTAANAVGNAGIAVANEEKVKISGGTVLEVLANMRSSITKVEQQIHDQVSKLASLTGTLANNVISVGDRIEIPSPNAAPGFKAAIRNPNNPAGFYPDTS